MTHGIICAAQPEAAEAGALALKNGGNAVDAAIACALAQGVIDPLMCGLGGVGSAVVHDAKSGKTENINFLGVAPAAARDDNRVFTFTSTCRRDDHSPEVSRTSLGETPARRPWVGETFQPM